MGAVVPTPATASELEEVPVCAAAPGVVPVLVSVAAQMPFSAVVAYAEAKD